MNADRTGLHADTICFSFSVRALEMSTNKPQTFPLENEQYPVLPYHIKITISVNT
jgi:hypothetical protein